jgi:hypothetical protein
MSDWPSIATAVGTLSLASVSAITLRQNRSLVKTASDEVNASNKLIAEVVRDRELRWQPSPGVDWYQSVVGSGGPVNGIELTNAGGGPALSCRLVVKQDGQDGWLTPAIDIPPGSSKRILADQRLDAGTSVPLSTWKAADGSNHNSESLGAIFTKDILGNRYRFLVVKDGSARAIIEYRELWRVGEQPQPAWAKSRVIWPDYGRDDQVLESPGVSRESSS